MASSRVSLLFTLIAVTVLFLALALRSHAREPFYHVPGWRAMQRPYLPLPGSSMRYYDPLPGMDESQWQRMLTALVVPGAGLPDDGDGDGVPAVVVRAYLNDTTRRIFSTFEHTMRPVRWEVRHASMHGDRRYRFVVDACFHGSGQAYAWCATFVVAADVRSSDPYSWRFETLQATSTGAVFEDMLILDT